MAFQSGSINPTTTSPASDITKITNDLAVLRSVLGGGTDSDVPVNLWGIFSQSGGSIGVGTASPAAKFDVVGAVGNGIRYFDGTVANFLGTGAGSIAQVGTTTSHSLQMITGGTAKVTIDTSGNLGIGVTPRAWGSTHRAIEVAGASTAHVVAYVNGINLGANYYNGGSGDLYATTGQPAQKFSAPVGGGYQWNIAPSGTAGNAIAWSQAMAVDSNGNLLVGATGLSLPAAGRRILAMNGTTSSLLEFQYSNNLSGYVAGYSTGFEVAAFASMPLIFAANNTQVGRFDTAGNLLVGTTGQVSAERFSVRVTGGNSQAGFFRSDSGATKETVAVWNEATTGDNVLMQFYTEASVTARGSIDFNRAGTAVRYNTTSDRRLKENIQDAPTAGGVIDAIKVRSFDWRESGAHTEFGFIAQELAEHVPDAVKIGDAADELGQDSEVWAVDFSKLVPLLVKEVQTLRARVAALEATK